MERTPLASPGVCLEQEGGSIRLTIRPGLPGKEKPAARAVTVPEELHRELLASGAAVQSGHDDSGPITMLIWPRQEVSVLARAWHITPSAQTRQALVNTVWPGLLTATGTALLAGPHMPAPQLLIPMALVLLAAGAACALRLVHQPLQQPVAVALVLASMAAWLVNVAVVPTEITTTYMLWLAWVASPIIHLVALASPLRISAWLAGGWALLQTAGLLWLAPDIEHFAPLVSIVTTGAGEVAITVLVLLVARSQAVREVEAAELALQLADRTAALQHAYQLDHLWSKRVTDEALPLLREVAEGRIDPDDENIRIAARTMEVSLRDELVLGPEHEPLLDLMAGARRRGWQLDSTLDRDDPAASLTLAHLLVGILGDPHVHGQPVTLSATGKGACLVILGPTSPDQRSQWTSQMDRLGGTLQADDDFVRLQLNPAAGPAWPRPRVGSVVPV
ncbi:hypothetical protein ACTQ49_10470 [Luteococcus sp. Sow4_B9]|uniref:hypothetical protein n=1 Tax=Luteococcus sp. Sow4_B9 TaxID=3438792 RepID=UPI003F9C608C